MRQLSFTVMFQGRAARGLLLLALGFMAVILVQTSTRAARQEKYLLIEEKISAMGNVKFYVGPKGLRFICPNLGYQAVCLAPTWQVIAFNPKAKLYVKRTLPQLSQSGFIPGKWSAPDIDTIKDMKGRGNFQGYQYVRYMGLVVHTNFEHHTTTSLTGLDLGRRARSGRYGRSKMMPLIQPSVCAFQ